MDKGEIKTLLGDLFANEADWRRSKIEQHPDDRRNAESACAYEKLANTIDTITELQLFSYKRLHDDDAFTLAERERELLGSMFHGRSYETASEFVADLLARAASPPPPGSVNA